MGEGLYRRRPRIETLAARLPLAAEVATNPLEPLDVNGDTVVDIQDVREVYLAIQLDSPSPQGFVDTNADEMLTLTDLRLVLAQVTLADERGPTIEGEFIEPPELLLPGFEASLLFGRVHDTSGVARLELRQHGVTVAEIDVDETTGYFTFQTTLRANHLSLVATDKVGNATSVAANQLVLNASEELSGAEGESGGSPRYYIEDGTAHIEGTDRRDSAWLFQFGSQRLLVMTFSPHYIWLPATVGHVEFNGHGGNDIFWLSPGVRTSTTFIGGEGNDYFFGGRGDDHVHSGPGNDIILSRAGNDHIDAGDGKDFVDAGAGNDIVDGGAGNDYITGRGGDDLIRGGEGNDIAAGDSGNDILLGNAGRDVLLGNQGRDFLIGGQNQDQLLGGSHEDILIGGTTLADSNDAALDAILREWTSDSNFESRVEAIMSGGGGFTGLRVDSSATVFDDQSRDSLLGGAGPNWHFAGPNDWVFDANSGRHDITVAPPRISNIPITTNSGVQQMPSIAVNPLNPQHLVVSYMDYSLVDTGYAGLGVATSFDGGASWEHSVIPVADPFDQGASNPTVRFNDDGQVFVSFMAATFLEQKSHLTNADFFDPNQGISPRQHGMRANNGIFVTRSDDGGVTWNAPISIVEHLFDGQNEVPFEVTPDLAIDTVSHLPNGMPNPRHGDMYIAWTRLYPPGQFPGEPNASGGGDIMVAVSQDNGLTWQLQTEQRDGVTKTVIQIYEGKSNSGQDLPPGVAFVDQAHVAVGAEGEVYVSNFGASNFTVHLSTDGGASFVEPNDDTGARTVFGTGFATFVNTDGLSNNQFRTHTVRAIAADVTRPGQIYAVEPISVLDVLGNQIDSADVFFGRSTDQGETWSNTFGTADHASGELTMPPLNDDNRGASATTASPEEVISGQALARLATDAQGNIGVIWYDTRRDPDDHDLDVFGTISTDGGQTFTPNFRISDVSFDADQGAFTNAIGEQEFYLGDSIGLAMADNQGFAVWTDTRNGNQDIFVSSFTIEPPPEALNDRFEPNNTPDLTASPTNLGRVVQRLLPNLTVTPGDQDWFLVETAATGELIAAAIYDNPLEVSDGSLELEIRNETGAVVLSNSSTLLDADGNVIGREVRLPSDAGNLFQVRVHGAAGQTVDYALRIQSLTADLGTRAFAHVNGSVATGGGALYLVNASAPGSFQFELTNGATIEGDLNVQILDPKSFELLGAGRQGQVTSATSAEPNDSISLANDTGLASPGTVTLQSTIGDGDFAASGDFDYYSFEAAANTRIVVDVNVSSLGSGLDSLIALYDSSGQLLHIVDGAGSGANESLTFTTDVGGTFFAAVLDFQAFPPSDPFVAGTGAGAGSTGEFQISITTEALGPGAKKQVSVPVRQDESFLVLVSGDEVSSGDFTLDITNFDQFSTSDSSTLFYPVGGGPSQATTGDLNNDGVPDVAVVNAVSNTVSVLISNSDGTLQVPRQFEIGAYLTPKQDVTARLPTFGRDLAIADVNGDGFQDIVATNFASSDVSVLIGRGDGTFEHHRRFEATTAPYDLQVADVNLDGNPDVVVMESVFGDSAVVSTLLGRGDGGFLPQLITEVAIGANNNAALRIGDFNEDGIPDVVTSGDGVFSRITVLIGNGDGTFTVGESSPAARLGVALAVDDVDGDGHLDVVAADFGELTSVWLLRGNGDGTFQDREQFFAGQSAAAVEIADLGSLTVLPDGSTVLGPPDGRLDVVLANSGVALAVNPVGGPEVVVLPARYDAAGEFLGFGAPQQLASGNAPQDVDVFDINNDAALDALVVDRDGVFIIYGEPPNVTPNNTPENARDLGTIVHHLSQTQTIVPNREDAYFKMKVPTEAAPSARAEVLDFSGFFQHLEGVGLGMEVYDSNGQVIGSGERFRVVAPQGEELLIRVFGLEQGGERGYGAFTLIVDVLPQVVSVEAQALLPGAGGNPGGPTTSLVLTFQGDRLSRSDAETATNYQVVALGPDGLLGTSDDVFIDVAQATYSPSTNVDVSTGRTFPTAVRQTVTLVFDSPLPSGAYQITVTGLRAAPFNEEELALLTDVPGFNGHPLVFADAAGISETVVLTNADLVLPTVALGDVAAFSAGTPFLTQLHADLGSVLDAQLTELGDDPSVTASLVDRALARLGPSLGAPGNRVASIFALILDPVSIDLETSDGDLIYDLDTDVVTNDTDLCYVEVGGNVEVIVCALPQDTDDIFTLIIDDATDVSRGAAILLGAEDLIEPITDLLRSGTMNFSFEF